MNQDSLTKLVKSLFSGLFTFIYFILLNILVIIFVLRTSLSNNLIEEVIKNNDFFETETNIETLAYIDPSDMEIIEIEDTNPNELSDEIVIKIEELLTTNNLPLELIGYINVNEDNEKEYMKLYENVFNYVLGVDEALEFPREEVSEILNKAIIEYEKDSEETVNRSGVTNFLNGIENMYKEYVLTEELINVREIFYTILFGPVYYAVLTISILLLIAIILLNLDNLKFLIKISIPHIVTGITYLSVSNSLKKYVTTEDGFIALFDAMKKAGISVLVIGLIGLATYYILKYTRKKEEDVYA